MSDDTTRRDPWEVDGTTVRRSPVTGSSPDDPNDTGYAGTTHEDRVDEEAARLGIERPERENFSAVTHPSNAAPEAKAFTNVTEADDPAQVAAVAFDRARYGEGRSVEEAVVVVKVETGLDCAFSIAEFEAYEAERPDKVAAAREHWEAIIASEPEPVTEDAA